LKAARDGDWRTILAKRDYTEADRRALRDWFRDGILHRPVQPEFWVTEAVALKCIRTLHHVQHVELAVKAALVTAGKK
jgi:hypothetical protein